MSFRHSAAETFSAESQIFISRLNRQTGERALAARWRLIFTNRNDILIVSLIRAMLNFYFYQWSSFLTNLFHFLFLFFNEFFFRSFHRFATLPEYFLLASIATTSSVEIRPFPVRVFLKKAFFRRFEKTR